MKIIAHRGFWGNSIAKNSLDAFAKALDNGFGIETDVRDCQGELVISHDLPTQDALPLDDFFNLYKKYDHAYPLALNIKSDGLQIKLKQLITQYQIKNYFVFDMSVPDGLHYLKNNMTVFTRESEYELSPSFYEHSVGVWLDEFHMRWIDKKIILKHVQNRKIVCVVSPELHKRSYEQEWNEYRDMERELGQCLMICTDYPALAKEFFGEDEN